MKIRYSKSQFRRKCVVCENPTGDGKVYEEGSISIRITVCDRDECHEKVLVKGMVVSMIREIKNDIVGVS